MLQGADLKQSCSQNAVFGSPGLNIGGANSRFFGGHASQASTGALSARGLSVRGLLQSRTAASLMNIDESGRAEGAVSCAHRSISGRILVRQVVLAPALRSWVALCMAREC